MNYKKLHKQAIQYLDNKQYKKALKLFYKLEKSRKNSTSFDIGYIYSELSYKYKLKEQKWLKKAIKSDSTAITNLAISYLESHKIKKAKKYFKKAILYNDIDACLDLAKIYLSEGKIKKALFYLTKIEEAKSYTDVTEDSKEKAMAILCRLRKKY